MRALHDSRGSQYRDPFGAALLGGVVTLGIDVWDDPNATCTIRLWVDGKGETFLPMEKTVEGDHLHFTGEVPLEELGITWYSFVLEGSGGHVFYYGAREGRTGGVGQMYDREPPSFQITVYHDREITPDWYKGSMVYQIFPDRYHRGADWRERVAVLEGDQGEGTPRELVEDWSTPPSYDRDANYHIKHWDFYGGTLQGITEKLDHIKAMGFTAIYLNPIFQARSNHRYDTADYLSIDPVLGTEEDFRHLCAEAAERGISIILDGVFNHTGTDSIYFNKYGNYPELGAWQDEKSPYHRWYRFEQDGTYRCWWGVDDLPDTDKNNPGWQEFVYGPGGVVEHWLEAGARGWRLDVADELTDDFIAGIKEAETRVLPDALLLGEVWEDASNKVAYGEMRHYLCGDELDSAMNYPFREALLHYLLNEWPADELVERMAQLKENYPPEAFASMLNLLGSHDRTRLFTMLGGAPDKDSMTEEQRGEYHLTEGQRGLAKGRLWLAALVQMCSPGVPCVYYGDEAGVEGYTDPYNRSTYPWGEEDVDCLNIYHNAIQIRQQFPSLVDGGFEPFCYNGDVYGFWRTGTGDDHRALCVLVNRSLSETHTVRVQVRGEVAEELVAGQELVREGDQVSVTLAPLGSALIYCHEAVDLVKPMERGMGIFCHITSLPNEKGPGTLGPEAYRFVDWLADCGQRYWQVLPVNPTDSFGSPYAGLSAFAGNTRLIDTGDATLEELFAKFEPDSSYDVFCVENARWLDPYATFMAIRDVIEPKTVVLDAATREVLEDVDPAGLVEKTTEDGKKVLETADGLQVLVETWELPWQEWPEPYRTWSPALMDDPKLKEGIAFHRFCQWLFQDQWDALKSYAEDHGVALIGDMPMYVSEDSADTWSREGVFDLGPDGHKKAGAGVPPDDFAPEGQLWGNPTYDWDALAERGYDWWLERLGRAFELYDYVRLDHFLGFEHYYSIPEGASALEGQWMAGPGIKLFEAAHKKFGPLPVIAEDLGLITPAIRGLVALCGVPGMDILEFADGDPRQSYVPREGKISYTSTHDTDTLLGWARERFGHEDDNTARTESEKLLATALMSRATVVMMPLQDVLGLGTEARMNVPGKAEGNWGWQANEAQIQSATPLLKGLAEESGRANERS